MAEVTSNSTLPKARLLDAVRERLATKHYSSRTVEAYVGWIRRFIIFHDRKHPSELQSVAVAEFLSTLATTGGVSASTQNQALAAILFLYSEVLHTKLDAVENFVMAKRPRRVPVVLTRGEVSALLAALDGVPQLMASLLYGSGLRLLECVTLRVKTWILPSARSWCGGERAPTIGFRTTTNSAYGPQAELSYNE
jgi:site-specific recombinase XerD